MQACTEGCSQMHVLTCRSPKLRYSRADARAVQSFCPGLLAAGAA